MLVTYTGKVFDFNDINKDSICITDVIHSLPHINRFLGHSSRPYSVGEHTYLGLVMAEELGYTALQRLHWFKHDFTEAYVGDCPTPLKRLLTEFKVIEHKVEKAIEEHLGLEPLTVEEEELVKRIDNTLLVLEMRDLTLHDYTKFIDSHTYTDILDDRFYKINKNHGMSTFDLKQLLQSSFDKLIKEVKGEMLNEEIHRIRRD